MSLTQNELLSLVAEIASFVGYPTQGYDGLKDDDGVELKLLLPVSLVRRLNKAVPKFDRLIQPDSYDADDDQDIPGDHVMTIDEWRESCAEGSLIDYDGSGYYAKDGHYSYDLDAACRDYRDDPPMGATHVVWFNK